MSVKRRLAILLTAWIVVPWTWAIVAEQRSRRGAGAEGTAPAAD